jgi:hypothetical protein
MEENDQQESGINALLPATQSEGLSLELIRTETVLSRLPVHNLAKQGRVNIQIIKTTASGEVELRCRTAIVMGKRGNLPTSSTRSSSTNGSMKLAVV